MQIVESAMLAEASHPSVLYHVAGVNERDSIMQHGLLRSKSWTHLAAMERGDGITSDENPWGGIFFASKPTYNRNFDLWAVNVTGLSIEPDDTTDPEDPDDTWWVTYDEDVPPERLKLVHAGNLTETLREASVPKWLTGKMYHGTARRNLDFQPGRVAYFIHKEEYARKLALMDAEVDGGVPKIIEATLDLHNPVRLDTMLMQDLHLPEHQELVRKLIADGHDCAIGEHRGEVCVLDPRHIHVTRIIDV